MLRPWLVSIACLLASCSASHAPRPRSAGELVAAAQGPLPTASCHTPDGDLLGTELPIDEVMSRSVNPTLSRVSMLLFHDPRPADDEARQDELRDSAEGLAACFATLTARRARTQPHDDGSEFEVYAVLQAHNTMALSDAAHERNRQAQLHWYQHVKETCNACHATFRFHTR